ncbi:XTP/dITP diphosphatase [Metabacillus herbersteinensis]|uniref:dITP/XTP pyrophosphatase n=1 Tax=Metabacillus herbersteinensis TaxID=283816 RepID=A0ABV6G953_9BACI
MKEIIIATKNKGKVNEFKEMLNGSGYQVTSLLDYPDSVDVEESGVTFVENAILKAEAISKHYRKITIADDSGLSIDYLNGAPGVFSARYAGEEKNDAANLSKVLTELKGVPEAKRSARFHCALAIASPEKETFTVEGICEGMITEKMEGENGFGYDPIFKPRGREVTMAQLPKEEKNTISHRADALKKLEKGIAQYF